MCPTLDLPREVRNLSLGEESPSYKMSASNVRTKHLQAGSILVPLWTCEYYYFMAASAVSKTSPYYCFSLSLELPQYFLKKYCVRKKHLQSSSKLDFRTLLNALKFLLYCCHTKAVRIRISCCCLFLECVFSVANALF